MLLFRRLSVTFVHCAQTAKDIDTISFAYDSPMSLPDCVKVWLTSVNFIPTQILPQSDSPAVGLSVGDIRWQIAAEWLEIA